LQVVKADQFVLLKVVEQLDAFINHFGQRQVNRRFAHLLETQTRGLQQMGAPHAILAPQINEAFGPARLGFAQPLDVAECRSIGAGIVIDEGGVITQTHTQGQLNRFHAG
jgi:hypothetical protein